MGDGRIKKLTVGTMVFMAVTGFVGGVNAMSQAPIKALKIFFGAGRDNYPDDESIGVKALDYYHLVDKNSLTLNEEKKDYTLSQVFEDNIKSYEDSYLKKILLLDNNNSLYVFNDQESINNYIEQYGKITEFLNKNDAELNQYANKGFLNTSYEAIKNNGYSDIIISLANQESSYFQKKYKFKSDFSLDKVNCDSSIGLNYSIGTKYFSEIEDEYSIIKSFRNVSLSEATTSKGIGLGAYNKLIFNTKEKIKLNSISFDLSVHYLFDKDLCFEGYNDTLKNIDFGPYLTINDFNKENKSQFYKITKKYGINWLKRHWSKNGGAKYMNYDFSDKISFFDYYKTEGQTTYLSLENKEIRNKYYIKDDETYHFNMTYQKESLYGNDYFSSYLNKTIDDDNVCLILEKNQNFALNLDLGSYQDKMIFNISNLKIDYEVIN